MIVCSVRVIIFFIPTVPLPSLRTSFHYNPALQSRSFLMLGVISQKAPTILITKTLSILDETLARADNDVSLMEALALCLARLVPLLDEVSQDPYIPYSWLNSWFSLIKRLPRTFIPTNFISHACCRKAAIPQKLNPRKPF